MKFCYPANCTTLEDRLRHLARARELLRRVHNVLGADVRAGKAKAASLEAWRSRYYMPRSTAIGDAQAGLMAGLKDAARGENDDALAAAVNMDADFEE